MSGEEQAEACIRAGQFFFDPKTGIQEIVELVLSSVRSVKSGEGQVSSSSAVSVSNNNSINSSSKVKDEAIAKAIPQFGEC